MHMGQTESGGQPWGLAVGLLAACLYTLLGVLAGHQPETILVRSAVGGGLIGFLAGGLAWGWKIISPANEEEL
jgi:hypothetical protein